MDLGPFMDAEMIAQLEPSLNRHFLGTPKNSKSLSYSPNGTMLYDPKLPPLPTASSSSDIYTKKIANFKQKLKAFKGMTNHNSEARKLKSPIVISAPIKSEQVCSNARMRVDTSQTPVIESRELVPTVHHPSANRETSLTNLMLSGKSADTLIEDNFLQASSPVLPTSETDSDFSVPAPLPQKRRTIAKEDRCALCDILLDTFYNIQEGERIIELQCRHMVHEECLFMEVEMNLSMKSLTFMDPSMIAEYLPPCNFCKNNQRCLPKEEQILSSCVTHLISMNLGKSTNRISSTGIYAPSPLTPTFSDFSKFMDSENTSASHTTVGITPPPPFSTRGEGSGKSTNTPSPNRRFKSDSGGSSKQTTPLSKTVKGHSKKLSRGSFALGHSSVVSSVDLDNDNDDDHVNDPVCRSFGYNYFSDSDFKRKLVRDLTSLSSHNIITPIDGVGFNLSAEFIRSLGDLRIVDRINMLDCSLNDNLIVTENYCYLFEHMLLTIGCLDFQFKLININRSTYIDHSESGSIILKGSMSCKRYYKLLFNSKELEIKWKDALADMKKKIEPNLTTSTLKMNEFDHLLDQSKKSSIVDDVATIGTLQSYVGEDGYRRLPTGVSPRFYEGTINSLIFQEKPSKAIIIINQSKLIKSSMAPVRNMIKSLSMIGIEILLLLCSTSTLSENSNVIDSYELGKKDLRRKEEELMETIERYENFLKMTAENGDGTAVCLSSGMCVGDKVRDYIAHAPQDMDLNEILNITVSNTSLRNFKDPMTSNKIFIEVGLDSRQKTNSSDVVDLAGWEDIMEVVCVYCGLEFDESDFYVSTDDELTDDSQSCDSGNSFLRDS